MTPMGSPTLARIRAAGILRVGTTGDYTPFSLLRPDRTYEGADIDMAHDLAAILEQDRVRWDHLTRESCSEFKYRA
jgi:cyclohexadienyl dehydratase